MGKKRKRIGNPGLVAAGNAMKDPVVKYAAIGLGAIVVLKMFGAIDGILEAVGLKDGKATKDLDQAAADTTSYWSPLFYKSAPAGAWLLTAATAKQYANEIYDAVGAFNDDEDAVIAVFKRLRAQSQVSQLADVFYQLHKADLLTFLRGGSWPQDRLSDADVNKINTYINSLPKYK